MSLLLVVDDNAIFREPIAASLQLAGYQTTVAADGKQALLMMRNRRPDLLLLDVAMPEMDGLALLRAMKRESALRDIPVILLTAVAERDYVVQAAQLGVHQYLLKSRFSLTQMLDRVREQLGKGSEARLNKTPAKSVAVAVGASVVDDAPLAEVASAKPPVSIKPSPVRAAVSPQVPPAEALKTLSPLVTRTQVNEQLESCGELKALSPTVGQILKATGSERCSIEHVTHIIKQDHAIALKILQLANSVVYTRGEPVDSLQKAVMRIGLTQIGQAVLNLSVVDQFNIKSTDRLNILQFWEHSIACGLIAAEITRGLGGKEVAIESAFTMGLLHDVGRLVYLDKFGPIYDQVFAASDELGLPLEQVETRLLLTNHADIMEHVLQGWRFPKHLIAPIASHHLSMGNIRHMSPKLVAEVGTLALANRLTHALLLGTSGNEVIYPTEEFIQGLRLNPAVVTTIENEIPGQTDDIKFAMLSSANQASWPQLRGQIAERFTQPLRPIYVSENPQIDAFRIFFDRVSQPPAEGEKPNIAVVQFTHVRERVAMTTRLKELEAAADVSDLPVVLISPSGNIRLEDRAMAERKSKLLPAPVSVSRLVDAVNAVLGD